MDKQGSNAEFSAKAHAKVNLLLKLHGRFTNGYHLISTLLAPIQLADDIEIAITGRSTDGESRVAIEAEIATELQTLLKDTAQTLKRELESERNLAVRAARALLDQHEIGDDVTVKIRITKRIPPQAGLGGGSSDAAAVLSGLNQLLRLEYTPEKLYKIGANIGSDVPALLANVPCLVVGSGGELRRLDSPGCDEWLDYLAKLGVVVVVPPFGVSTEHAYAMVRREKAGLSQISEDKVSSEISKVFAAEFSDLGIFDSNGELVIEPRSGLWDLPGILNNEFEDVLFPTEPRLSQLAAQMRGVAASRSGGVALSGSGSAIFAVVESQQAAELMASEFEKSLSNCWVCATRFLDS